MLEVVTVEAGPGSRLGRGDDVITNEDERPMSMFGRFSSFLWFIVVGGVAAMTVGGGALEVAAQSSDSQATTEEAPDFALQTLDDESFRLQDHQGEVVVLNFWATWCAPCRREIPHFVTMQKELGDQGLQFVGVALERDAGPDKVRAFAEKMEINYPVGLGDGSIAEKYGGVRGLPMTFIIGPEGTIREHVRGMTTESMIRPTLEALLKEAS